MTKSRFQNQIIKLKDDLLELLWNVRKEHEDALLAIENHEYEISKEIIKTDREIRKVAESITTTAIWRITANQPIAGDLRKIIGYMNIIRDLERISNYAKNISKFNVKYKPEKEIINELVNLMQEVFEMIDLIAEAIDKEDINIAYQAAKKDMKIDENYKKAINKIAGLIKNKEQDLITLYAAGLQQLKYVERLGDHLVNICETIVYINKGKLYDLSIPIEEQ